MTAHPDAPAREDRPTAPRPSGTHDPARRILDLGIICGALTGLAGLARDALVVAADEAAAGQYGSRAAERIAAISHATRTQPRAVATLAATLTGPAMPDVVPVARLLLATPTPAQAHDWAHDPPPKTVQDDTILARGWPVHVLILLDEPTPPTWTDLRRAAEHLT